jgi:tryptophan halogenase
MTNFPDKSFNQPDIDYYNGGRGWNTNRSGISSSCTTTPRSVTTSPFWNYCRTMEIPQSLAERIAIYRENARLYRHDNELFSETSWFAVMHGQNIAPARYHPVADILPQPELASRMTNMSEVTQKCLSVMPTHQAFIDRYCKAEV